MRYGIIISVGIFTIVFMLGTIIIKVLLSPVISMFCQSDPLLELKEQNDSIFGVLLYVDMCSFLVAKIVINA